MLNIIVVLRITHNLYAMMLKTFDIRKLEKVMINRGNEVEFVTFIHIEELMKSEIRAFTICIEY